MSDVNPIRADGLQGVRHGFFTREGGVSTGIYAGLNCGVGSNDAPENVAENRRRVAVSLGAEPEALTSLYQVHSADVITIDEPLSGERPKADAMVSKTPGIALGVLSADCAPILFSDRTNGVIGAAHAGWRGALAGVAVNVITKMEALGAKRETMKAAIGPCISQAAYEVGPEFVDTFLESDPENVRFFGQGKGDRAQFNLPGFLLSKLAEAGVEAEWTGHCTYSDPDRFFSYRRNTHDGLSDYGRLIAAITL